MARTLIEKVDKVRPPKYFFFFFDNDIDDVDDVVGGLRGGNLGFLRAQTQETRPPLLCRYS
jgi:hypothetical protein